MKKRKAPLKKSKAVLLPILSENENCPKVIEKLREFDKVILIFVMDSDAVVETASAGTKIKHAEKLMEEIERKLKSKEVSQHIEWGSTALKIKNIGLLERAGTVILVDTQRCKTELEEEFEVKIIRTKY